MSPNGFKYAEVPVFQYQTFDIDSCTFTDRPIIPLERVQFTDRNADDLYKSKDPDAELEVIELDPPTDPPAEDTPAENAPKDDGMPTPFRSCHHF